MVFLGFWFIFLGLWGAYRWYRGELFEDRLLLKSFVYSMLAGIFATEFGWIVTEVGRQPWLFKGSAGEMTTAEGVTTTLSSWEATLTLLGFVVVYGGLLVTYVYIIRRLIMQGPPELTDVGDVTGPGEPTPGVANDD
jgi:cytochrome d ubiquinol oxidase subunit I